jgi:DNA helicase-2/ATP-dependent DNA helicase PcrA
VDPNRLVVIEAGAGSGKTRVLTSRIAYRVATGTADAEHTAVFTFTRKAAAELGHRLAALGVQGAWCGTVHGAARQLLDRYWSDLGRRPLVIRTDTERLVAEALGPDDGALAGVVHRELAWAGPRAIAAADYPAAARAAGRGRGLAVEDVAQAMARYETYKRRRGVMDLDDLLRLAASAMEDRRFRDAVHWRFRHLAIDEAQDLNRAQWQFLRQLLGDPADCCLVGDADQTVYEWNGADARFLTGFHRLFPGASRHQLATNFRSAPPIVALGDRILGRTDATPAASERAGTITVLAAADEEDEAAQVAWRVRQLRGSGAGWSQIAVLARTRALLEPTERRLRAAGIPVRTGRGLLEEPVVAAVLAELARLPADRPARTVAVDVAEVADDVVERRRSQGAGDEREQARCAQLVELVQEWASNDPMATAGQLGNWLASVVRPVGGEPGDPAIGVELATFHRAKGLQFPHVLLVGLEDGVVPLAHSAQPAEERRLLYVAVTRAEQSLTCSWAARRRVGGIERDRAPSPWLATVEEVGGRWEASAAGSPASAREQVAALRCRLEGVRRSA